MSVNRRELLSAVAVTAGVGSLAGCTGDEPASGSESAAGSGSSAPTAQSSFFVFGDITAQVAGSAADAELLVPVGQHGHGWEPGPSVREDIRDADLLVHGMDGFQPWVDDIRTDLEADDADVTTVDVSSGLELLAPGSEHHHGEEGHEGDDDHGHGTMDPHFWMDPLRVKDATGNVERTLAEMDPSNEDAYTENADGFRAALDELHERIEATISSASKEVLLVAGHDSWQYFGDRYGVTVEALTNVSPDDRPTPRDIARAQEIIETHDLRYICADPLESQRAAEQLVGGTDAEAVLPLTAMPGLTDEWESEDWGYLEVMEKVNLPALEDALDA